jgi:DNA invertase Pin-like site-specific DNA recombinase
MNYVAYYRVSTQKQGQSGLGLEAQRAMVESLVRQRSGTVIAEVTEVETGKRNDRPKLTEAIRLARVNGATLLVAKLDRLARNVMFIATLMESKLPLICCDMPEADQMTLHIFAALAEKEAAMISERTKSALKALQARGVKLGSHRQDHWTPERKEKRADALRRGNERMQAEMQEEMRQQYEPIIPWIRDMRENGDSLRKILEALNDRGCQTRTGTPWNMSTLRRVIAKYLGNDYLGQKTGVLNRCKILG